ncbi:MAG: NAD(P)H-hydrate dehydratase [Clostridiales bacterium]|nr:NAD(P)H-hydrate dehydratase [Clostridiales bacterium]
MTEVREAFVRRCLPVRDRDGHKGTFGKVHILAGSVGFTGAPALSSAAAVRTGSGLVHLWVPQEIWPVLAVKCQSAMPAPVPPFPALLEKLDQGDGVLIGPGLGRSRKTDVRTCRLLQRVQTAVVLDADGINAVAEHIDVLDTRRGRVTVLTPHDGEFLRLTGGAPLGPDREAAAAAFARAHGCVLVLKGHRTITAFPDGETFVNTTGNPGMAKGGSGDVLAGMLLSLLGQGLPPKQAVPAAVWLHGRAGDLAAEELGEYGMTPDDLLRQIPAAIRQTMAGPVD